jgi:hypothetical protein
MSPPSRPYVAPSRLNEHPEPRLGVPGVEPLRALTQRLAVAKPSPDATVRLPSATRPSQDLPRLSVAPGDRLIMSFQKAGDGKPRRRLTRIVGFVALLLLAGFGVFTICDRVAGAFTH